MERRQVTGFGVAVVALLSLVVSSALATADWCEDCYETENDQGISQANCCTSDLSCDQCNWCANQWTFVYGLLDQCIIQGNQADGYTCGASALCDDNPWGGGGGGGGGWDPNPFNDIDDDCNTGGFGYCPPWCAWCY